MRLHETLKQCQDLKTEKSQMDRKINQLSEENGDLSFKVCYVPTWGPLELSFSGQFPKKGLRRISWHLSGAFVSPETCILCPLPCPIIICGPKFLSIVLS